MTEAKPVRIAGDERLARITRIAELVGCPVEDFQAPTRDALGDALELVRLWERIDTAGRAHLLAVARTEAARTGEPQQAGHAGATPRGRLR